MDRNGFSTILTLSKIKNIHHGMLERSLIYKKRYLLPIILKNNNEKLIQKTKNSHTSSVLQDVII